MRAYAAFNSSHRFIIHSRSFGFDLVVVVVVALRIHTSLSLTHTHTHTRIYSNRRRLFFFSMFLHTLRSLSRFFCCLYVVEFQITGRCFFFYSCRPLVTQIYFLPHSRAHFTRKHSTTHSLTSRKNNNIFRTKIETKLLCVSISNNINNKNNSNIQLASRRIEYIVNKQSKKKQQGKHEYQEYGELANDEKELLCWQKVRVSAQLSAIRLL